jgi:hypothetical protein
MKLHKSIWTYWSQKLMLIMFKNLIPISQVRFNFITKGNDFLLQKVLEQFFVEQLKKSIILITEFFLDFVHFRVF